ncbi:MAG TPA: hypothetical protein RMH99_32530, partial [Sandaracinaceae bacterium LLY-WYZ-13_1]|nr:hypothetical protein [Sandaracinaceae bacterium LLY-WYZ-13_1]
MRTRTLGTRTLERRSIEGASFPPVRRIEWAGDTYSYVDVYFDAPFRSLIRGEDFAPFVRYRWVPGSFVVLSNPSVDIAGLPAGVPVGQATSIRHYDRGACSADVSWRAVARGLIEEGLDVATSEMGTGYSVLPSGNWVLTPVLRPEFLDISIDAFRIYRRYDVSIANVFGGSFEIRLLAGFRTSD